MPESTFLSKTQLRVAWDRPNQGGGASSSFDPAGDVAASAAKPQPSLHRAPAPVDDEVADAVQTVIRSNHLAGHQLAR